MAATRDNVFPTRMNLTITKTRLKGAQTGHSLLKRKSEALTSRFRVILRKIEDAKLKMGKIMQNASFSLAEVAYITGDISYQVIKLTNRRVNAIEYVIIPRIENAIARINSGLDEQDREEFYRLKKVQTKKKERAANAQRELDELALLAIDDGNLHGTVGDDDQGVRNLLAEQADEDIIF
ncbi:H(+)-transporting V1 sector ATPase subunit D [Coemansia biformis]|uniref:H(+)-transporting V1 sector ATPase subunit D n=1 Tax=Coemansia biformis TaxID=1286918 RepID=A0A9W7Y9D3_9FUNG|nr:H(+)-transporting V1 sector ATPase subunit D [Coemansia biformis]